MHAIKTVNCARSAANSQCVARASARLLYTVSPAPGHDKAGHPETKGRVEAIDKALQTFLLRKQHLVQRVHTEQRDSQMLLSSLQLVHPANYLARLEEICTSLKGPTMVDESTYIAPDSFTACCETAAAVLAVLDAVLAGSATATSAAPGPAGFCLVRPPGHHVLATRPMGFGLMNFIAVAARHAQQQHVVPVRKVLIVDFDVHHGNGTEDIFYKDPTVFYISTHQQGLWPYTGKLQSVGAAAGVGYTINLPLPGGSGHQAMQMVLEQVILPAARRFQPNLVLVSAGYDAHWHDPLAGLQFQCRTYHMLCQAMVELSNELCNGRCLFILEGGYEQASVAEAVCDSFIGIFGGPSLDTFDPSSLQEEPLHKVATVLTASREVWLKHAR